MTTGPARRHVPATSPSTSTAPGQTRGVQSSSRRPGSGTSSSRSAPWRRKYASPLGRSRAVATSRPTEVRNASSSSLKIHASPTGVRTGVSDPASASKVARPRAGTIPAHPANASAVAGPKTWRYRRASSSRASLRIDGGWRHRPDRRSSRAVPSHHHSAGRGGIAQRIGVHAKSASRLAVGHRPAVEERFEPVRQLLRIPTSGTIVGQPPKGEHRSVAFGDHVRAEPWPPQLHQRRVLPAARLGTLDTGMDRQERGPRHAVLQAGPRRGPQRVRTRRESLIEAAGASSKR